MLRLGPMGHGQGQHVRRVYDPNGTSLEHSIERGPLILFGYNTVILLIRDFALLQV